MRKDAPKPEPRAARNSDAIKRLFSFQLGAVYGKSIDQLSKANQGQLNALRLYFTYRHNGFVLLEALDLCVTHKVNPPAWVLESINDGLREFKDGNKTLQGALSLGKRHREEYRQYREQQPVMAELRKLISKDDKRRIDPACVTLAGRKRLNAATLAKQYRKFWRGFFDYVGVK